jgi:arginine exporter protein ArgO
MSLLISGIVSVILGVIGLSQWSNDFLIILKGGVPIMLILGGVLAVYVGLDAIQDRMREERQKHWTKPGRRSSRSRPRRSSTVKKSKDSKSRRRKIPLDRMIKIK